MTFRPVLTGDAVTNRNFDAIASALAALDGQKRDAAGAAVVIADAGVGSESLLVFRGSADAALTLPRASASASVSRTLYLRHDGAGAWTVRASGNDAIDGAASFALAAGEKAILISDGAANWFRFV